VRFVLAANEVLALQDRTGALASRFIMLQMSISWLGREDLDLGDRLITEAPAILNWALDGLRRLTARGRFIQPATGMQALQEAEEVGSPIITFVHDCCEVCGQEWWADRDALYVEWVGWHQRNNLKAGSRSWFFRDLKAAFPSLRDYYPKGEDGVQRRAYRGIKLIGRI
jgi:putative DNA primase/helicase